MNCHYAPLPGEALLHITGPDTLTFLQGQTTCDTTALSAERAVAGVYCTPKGRVVCDFLLTLLGEEHYALRMRRAIRSNAATVFGKYIIFSKATIDAERDDWLVLGVWGEDASALILDTFGEVPAGRYDAISGDGYCLVQVDGGDRFECHYDPARAATLIDTLQSKSEAASEEQWRAAEIQQGIARMDEGLVDEFVPQTLNYDITGHISFTKGCYTGQEVVARLHYRGTPKRRSFIAHLPKGTQTSPMQDIYADEGGNSIGDIVNAEDFGDETIALVAITTASTDSSLHLGGDNSEPLSLHALPYTLEAS